MMVMMVATMPSLVPSNAFAFNLTKHKKLAQKRNTESQFKIGEYFRKNKTSSLQ